ncbi:MAG: adenosine deaminase [Elusimicrobia bacterium]|nr:adenosine deaminase [Elusimicrobiota bacterium]
MPPPRTVKHASVKPGRPPSAKNHLELLRRMPKADIHCHLDGSLRPATVLELARERGVKLPGDSVEEITPHVQVAPTCRSLREFLDVFDLIVPLLRDAPALERIAYELCEDCALENIRHVEVRYAPVLNATARFTVDDTIEAVLRGLSRGLKDFGVTSGVILCLFRSHGPQENRRVFSALKRFFKPANGLSKPGVVGMDLAGDEARYPTMEYASFYEEARARGIRTTCHAGETVGTANLQAALALEVHRIGHGTHLMEDARLLKEVVRRNIPLEIGITSNVRTKTVPDLRSHPARRFYDQGVPITLNTDDRGVIGIDLTHEYEAALELGFSVQELMALSLKSVDHLFLPAVDRDRLRKKFTKELESLGSAP